MLQKRDIPFIHITINPDESFTCIYICVKCSCSDNEKYISLSLYCMAQSSDCNGWFAKWLIINLLLAIFYRYFSRLLVGKNNIDNWQIWRVGFIFIKVHRDPIPRWAVRSAYCFIVETFHSISSCRSGVNWY